LSNLHKIGKYGKEVRGKSGKLSITSGKIGAFIIVSIETASTSESHLFVRRDLLEIKF